MPSFAFRGRDARGGMVHGVAEGPTSSAVADQLFGQGITPLDITPARGLPGADATRRLTGFFAPKVHALDVLLFSRQLHTLLKAGVPIMRALNGLQESSANAAMKGVLGELRSSLDSGRELSASLARHPDAFTPFYVSMVRVAEMTGRLEEVFFSLFQHLEFEKFMREQVKSALRYPTFVVIAMAVALVIVNIFVIPAFAKVFKGFGAELPLMTKILVGFSDFMVAYGWLLLAAAVGTLFMFRAWTNTTAGRFAWDRFKMRIPIAGKIVHKATLARLSRSLALAVKSGVPVVQGMSVVAQTVDNAFIESKIMKMREGVERGESIWRTAVASGVFTPVVLQMIAVGEESGALDDMMQEIADMYQSEVEYELKTLGQQIEPILIVFLSLLVLVLALGIFLPIWDLGKAAIK
jgi:MSHA biogenesis protein MshG